MPAILRYKGINCNDIEVATLDEGGRKQMVMRWLLAALHLLPLGLGLGAVLWRAVSLRGPLDRLGLQRVFLADTIWGLRLCCGL